MLKQVLAKTASDPGMALRVAESRLRAPFMRNGPPAWRLAEASAAEVARVSAAFTAHGSDKASTHNYGGMYASLLQLLPPNPRILEIGVGTNYTDVPCNMGEHGRPGASLRALRDLRPDATIFGADVDRRVLFQEESITTHWVDQLDRGALRDLLEEVGGEASLDLVVDDGLHSKRSNLNTFEVLFRGLRSGGLYVVEDLDPSAIPLWRTLLAKRRLRGQFFDMRDASGWDIDIAVVIESDRGR